MHSFDPATGSLGRGSESDSPRAHAHSPGQSTSHSGERELLHLGMGGSSLYVWTGATLLHSAYYVPGSISSMFM